MARRAFEYRTPPVRAYRKHLMLVIPGRHAVANPEPMTTDLGYGFQALAFRALAALGRPDEAAALRTRHTLDPPAQPQP